MPAPATPAKRGTPSLSFQLLAGTGFVVVCLGLFAPRFFATGSVEPPTTVPSPPPVSGLPSSVPDGSGLGWSLGKMLLGVGGVAVACVGVSRYLSRRPAPTVNPNLQVLASLPVDARCVVHLVRVGDRRLLVGVDPTGVKVVTELGGSAPPADPQVIGPVRVSVASEPVPADLAALLGGELHTEVPNDGRPERPVHRV